MNRNLADNHQLELAMTLAEQKYLCWCYPETLNTSLHEVDWDSIEPYPAPKSDVFGLLLHHELGST